MKNNISEIIKENRISKKLSQQDLANYLNVSRQAVSNWENSISYPDQSLINKLSKILGVDASIFYDEKVNNNINLIINKAKKKHYIIYGFLFIIILFLIFLSVHIYCKEKTNLYELSLESDYFKLIDSYYYANKNNNYISINFNNYIFNITNIKLYNNSKIIYNGKESNIKLYEKDKIKNLSLKIEYSYHSLKYEETIPIKYDLINSIKKSQNKNKLIYKLNTNLLLENKYLKKDNLYIKEANDISYTYNIKNNTFEIGGGKNYDAFYAIKDYNNKTIKIGFKDLAKKDEYVTIYLNDSLVVYNNNQKFDYMYYFKLLLNELIYLESM